MATGAPVLMPHLGRGPGINQSHAVRAAGGTPHLCSPGVGRDIPETQGEGNSGM